MSTPLKITLLGFFSGEWLYLGPLHASLHGEKLVQIDRENVLYSTARSSAVVTMSSIKNRRTLFQKIPV